MVYSNVYRHAQPIVIIGSHQRRTTNAHVGQLLVSCGCGQRPVNGLRQQHVHTIQLLVWDTLEDFTTILHDRDEDNHPQTVMGQASG